MNKTLKTRKRRTSSYTGFVESTQVSAVKTKTLSNGDVVISYKVV